MANSRCLPSRLVQGPRFLSIGRKTERKRKGKKSKGKKERKRKLSHSVLPLSPCLSRYRLSLDTTDRAPFLLPGFTAGLQKGEQFCTLWRLHTLYLKSNPHIGVTMNQQYSTFLHSTCHQNPSSSPRPKLRTVRLSCTTSVIVGLGWEHA